MTVVPLQREPHRTGRVGWLRAAVLGANDGIISTSSLMVGVAASAAARHEIVVAGVAGMVAGALSMAAGEYVSVSSQADTEHAELDRERQELEAEPDYELQELANIYVRRGLQRDLAHNVAVQLMAANALAAHARDELGLSEELAARPVQAALASAASFAVGAALPLATAILAPGSASWTIFGVTVVALLALGSVSAAIGGAPMIRASVRVTFWGALAMALTAGAGWIFGVS